MPSPTARNQRQTGRDRETQGDTGRHRERQGKTQMLRETHKDIERHREALRDTQSHRETHTATPGETHRDTQLYRLFVCTGGAFILLLINLILLRAHSSANLKDFAKFYELSRWREIKIAIAIPIEMPLQTSADYISHYATDSHFTCAPFLQVILG